MPIRRKKLKYKSDYMSRQMDDRLEQIEERLSALYKASTKEMQAKLEEFTNSYEKNSELMRAKVEAGEMTEEEYALWTQRHIIQTDRYKATIDSLATMAVNADKAAMALVNGELPYVIAQSYNFTTSLGWKAADEAGLSVGTFQVYNADSVQKLIRDNPDILPVVDVPEDERWNRNRINQEITKSIVNGDSSQQVADRLQRVTNMDRNSAVRNARTAMTSAENMGRAEAADYLKSKGVPMDEVWSATYDDRTRETHLMLDGTKRDENGVFGADILLHPLRFPADPLGDPEEVYNCRCRLNLVLQGIDHSQDDDLYEQFMKEQHPEDWKNLQENRGYQAKQEQEKKALERKERLLASKEEKLIPPPEKISLEDVKEDANAISEEQTEIGIVSDNLPASTIEVIGEKGEPIPPETLAETVNPHYLEAGYTENCQRCVVGYELGRRGYDVEAMAFDGSYLTTQSVFDISTQFKSGENFGTYITGEKYNPRHAQDKYPFNQSPKTTANSIVRAMTDWGDGSRATLEVSWRSGGGAHIVNVENIGGVVKIIDAQSGMIFDNIEGYLSRTKCAETELRRTDILEIRDNIPQEIMERVCRKRG